MENGAIQPDIRFPVLAAHVWFVETGIPWTRPRHSHPVSGASTTATAMLCFTTASWGRNPPTVGMFLPAGAWATIRAAQGEFVGPLTVYGERATLREAALKAEAIAFKQTPYDVKIRQ